MEHGESSQQWKRTSFSRWLTIVFTLTDELECLPHGRVEADQQKTHGPHHCPGHLKRHILLAMFQQKSQQEETPTQKVRWSSQTCFWGQKIFPRLLILFIMHRLLCRSTTDTAGTAASDVGVRQIPILFDISVLVPKVFQLYYPLSTISFITKCYGDIGESGGCLRSSGSR